jgi:hypothetical protein
MDYDDILNRSWDDIPEPKLLPGGNWLMVGKNAALVKPKEEGKSLKILFTFGAKSPVDVAEDLLDELGDYDVTINEVSHTIYLETASDWNKVRKFLALVGIEMEGSILDEAGKLSFNKAFRGSEIVAEVGQRSYDDAAGETIWQNTLAKFQKVAE